MVSVRPLVVAELLPVWMSILMVFLFSVLFSPGIIPMYLTVKQLGLLDSYWALILFALINGFNVIVMRAFFL